MLAAILRKSLYFGVLFVIGFALLVQTNRVEAAGGDDFIITVDTSYTGTTTNTQFSIQTFSSETYNYNVDCDNDGNNEITGAIGAYTCNYPSAGIYTIRISDNVGDGTGFPRIYFNNDGDKEKLTSIDQWGTGKWTSMENAFFGCSNMTYAATDAPDLSSVTNFVQMFRLASSFNGDIGAWNTSTITNMGYMFFGASAFNQDIGSWDTSMVTDMSYMFRDATVFNQDISGWDTGSVTNFRYLFNNATAFNQNLNSWDTSSVTSMDSTFYNAYDFNQPIGNWDTSLVTTMRFMFRNAYDFNQDIGSWDTSLVTDFSWTFLNATEFNQDIGGWNTSSATKMDMMFNDADAFNQDIGSWDTSLVTDMNNMFYSAGSFNQDISGWDTGSVTDMNKMFQFANEFNQNLGSWNVTALEDASDMFTGVKLSTANYDALLFGWNAQTLQTSVSFTGGNSNYCKGETARTDLTAVPNSWTITDGGKDCTEYDHFVITVKTDNSGSSTDTQFGIPTSAIATYNYNVDCDDDGVDEVTGATGSYICNYALPGTYTIRIKDNVGDGTGFPRIFFNNAFDKLKLVSIDQWGTGKWTSMQNAFYGCANMTHVATDSPDLSNVINMQRMFSDASSFNGNIGNWDTSNVTNMFGVFYNASSFNQFLDNWDTSSVTIMAYMFQGATVFNGDIDSWDTSIVQFMGYMFMNAPTFNQPIGVWETGQVTDMSYMFFSAASFNQDISSWDTSSVANMTNMFSGGTTFNQDIGGWDTGSVEDMRSMFANATSFDQNIGGWDVGSVTQMDEMFEGVQISTANYDGLLNGWDAQVLQSNVTFDGGNSSYCAGEAARLNMQTSDNWTITDGDKDCTTLITQEIFYSQAAYDGWVLETGENTNAGGLINTSNLICNVGDDAGNKQYRTILHFNTSRIPDDAIITQVTLQYKQHSIIGSDPYATHGNIWADIKDGFFSNNAGLVVSDFAGGPSMGSAGWFEFMPSSLAYPLYRATLKETAYQHLNLDGITQFRLRFGIDDDNDSTADYIKIFCGDMGVPFNRPVLRVWYYVP